MNELEKTLDFLKDWEYHVKILGPNQFKKKLHEKIIAVDSKFFSRDIKITEILYHDLISKTESIPKFDDLLKSIFDFNLEVFEVKSKFEFKYGSNSKKYEEKVYDLTQERINYEKNLIEYTLESPLDYSQVKDIVTRESIKEYAADLFNEMSIIYSDTIYNFLKEYFDNNRNEYIAPKSCNLNLLLRDDETSIYFNNSQLLLNEEIFIEQVKKVFKTPSSFPDYTIDDYIEARFIKDKEALEQYAK